ncbi:MAG: ATP-binding protein [Clostridia bacterium]|nr:ATP-binding protein [Clostridia bacterium]
MNKTDIINSEKNKLRQKRMNAEIKAQNTLQTLRKNPDFSKLESDLRTKMLALVKTELGSSQEKKLRKEYDAILEKQQKLLAKLGFSQKDITPQYNCQKCQDTGYNNYVMCDCLKKNIRQRLQQESGLGNFKGHKFLDSNAELLERNPTLKKAYAYAVQYVKNFPYNKLKNIIFSGTVGTGKTFLSECIANALIQRDYYVVYITSFELNNIVIKSMDIFADNREEVLSPLLECDLLIIDDLGSEPIYKNASVKNLYTIINQRQLAKNSTIISTNLSPQMIRDQYGDRLFSRLFDKQTTMAIQFDGKDLRINK